MVKPKLREQVAWLLVLTAVATLVDVLVITNKVAFTGWDLFGWLSIGYHIIGWFAVWLACFLITGSFLISIASVMIISGLEDSLFIVIARSFNGISIYPLYCHEWMADMLGSWSGFLGLNWLGVPSSYFILPAIAVLLITIEMLKRTNRK